MDMTTAMVHSVHIFLRSLHSFPEIKLETELATIQGKLSEVGVPSGKTSAHLKHLNITYDVPK
jgi:hypothetical protein